MTTKHIEDISHKRFVNTKYMPNTYRIFCEDISNDSMNTDQKYQSQAPPLYTQPMIIPAQAIEDRNHPHGGRHATFLRENARTLNEPVAKISTTNTKDVDQRWWEWNTVSSGRSDDYNSKSKQRRSKSNAPSSGSSMNGASDLQTTYQKDHGYLKDLMSSGDDGGGGGNARANSGSAGATRHGANPNTREAKGIVPVNDLNSYTKQGEEQRVFVDKMSFDHQYDSRKDPNYPNMGKRHGAFVLDQVNPRPVYGHRTVLATENSNGASIWDLMQPLAKRTGVPSQQQPVQPVQPVHPINSRRRRDPIGYFSDSKYGDMYGYAEKKPSIYEPSWTNGTSNGAMQQPITVNEGDYSN